MEIVAVLAVVLIVIVATICKAVGNERGRRNPMVARIPRDQDNPPNQRKSVQVKDILDRTDVLLIDTETTGLTPNSVIVEAAVCDTTGAVRYHSYFQLPKGVRFQAEATRANGLTRKKLEEMGAKSFDAEWPILNDVLRKADLVFSWNAEFEVRLLNQTQKKWGVDNIWGITINDVLEGFRDGLPGLGGYSLQNVAQAFGISFSQAEVHTARGDIRILLEILQASAAGKMPTPIPPTDKQLNFIESLEDELGVSVDYPNTKAEASELIDALLQMRRR